MTRALVSQKIWRHLRRRYLFLLYCIFLFYTPDIFVYEFLAPVLYKIQDAGNGPWLWSSAAFPPDIPDQRILMARPKVNTIISDRFCVLFFSCEIESEPQKHLVRRRFVYAHWPACNRIYPHENFFQIIITCFCLRTSSWTCLHARDAHRFKTHSVVVVIPRGLHSNVFTLCGHKHE